MKVIYSRVYSRLFCLMHGEEGQDLIEYSLTVALIAFGATAAMNGLAVQISSVFSNIGAALTI